MHYGMTPEEIVATSKRNRAEVVARYMGQDLPSRRPAVVAAIAAEGPDREEWVVEFDTYLSNNGPAARDMAIDLADSRIAGFLFDRNWKARKAR